MPASAGQLSSEAVRRQWPQRETWCLGTTGTLPPYEPTRPETRILVHFLAEVLFAVMLLRLPFACCWNSADLFAPEPAIAEAHIISISIVISLAFNGALLGLGQALAMDDRGLPTSIPLSTGLLALAWGLDRDHARRNGHRTPSTCAQPTSRLRHSSSQGALLAAAQYVIIRNSVAKSPSCGPLRS